MTSGRSLHRDPAMRCPHCEGAASIRNSTALTPLVRRIRYRCENDECGHIFIAHLEAIRTVVPSARPNPDVALPVFGRAGLTTPTPANDHAPVPANDDGDDAAIAAPLDPMTP